MMSMPQLLGDFAAGTGEEFAGIVSGGFFALETRTLLAFIGASLLVLGRGLLKPPSLSVMASTASLGINGSFGVQRFPDFGLGINASFGRGTSFVTMSSNV
jgi:hypothetical protein